MVRIHTSALFMFICVIPRVQRVQAGAVLLDGDSEHGAQLGDDPPPGVQPGRAVAQQPVPGEQVLQGKLLFEKPRGRIKNCSV